MLYHAKTMYGSILYSMLSALGCVFIVESRPNALLPAALFCAPLIYKIFFDSKSSKHQKRLLLLAGGIVLLVGACLVCKYNYDRFGNIFDFGKNYQLTAYDPNSNAIRFNTTNLFNAMYYYVLEMPTFLKKFPFILLNNTPVDGQGHYLLKDPNMGLIMLPMLWTLIWYRRARGLFKKFENAVIILGMLGCGMGIYAVFCMGGVQLRYHTDYVIILFLISFVIMMKYAERGLLVSNSTEENRVGEAGTARACIVLCTLTIFVGLLLIFSNQMNAIKFISPDIYYQIANLFSVL